MTDSPNEAPRRRAPETRRDRFAEAPFPAGPLTCATRPVEPGWIDYNGHMNVGFYSLAFDQALDVAYDEWLRFGAGYVSRTGMGPFALQSHLHYLRELREGQRFVVDMLMLDVDAKRIHYVLTMRAEGAEETSAVCEAVSVNVDLNLRRSAPFPEETRRRFEEMRDAQTAAPRPQQVGRGIGLRRAAG